MAGRTALNQKANKIIKKKVDELGLDHCEYPGCHEYNMLSIAHRYDRRHFRNEEELSDRKYWCVMCLHHHHHLDHTAEGLREKEDVFDRILGKLPKELQINRRVK